MAVVRAVGWLRLVVRYSLFVQELFCVVARQKIAWRTNYLHLAYIKVVVSTARGRQKMDRAAEFEERRFQTWQRTEILLPALHHWK